MTCTAEDHAAIKADPKRWSALRFHSYQFDGTDIYEQRNCACGSTLAKIMKGWLWDAFAKRPVPRQTFTTGGEKP